MPAATEFPRILPLADTACTVEFGPDADDPAAQRVLGFCRVLDTRRAAGLDTGVLEWVPALRSVTVHFDPDRLDARVLMSGLLDLARQDARAEHTGRCWQLPVCFDPDLAPDLLAVAHACGLSVEALVARFTGCDLRVSMLGFLPGFPYLSGLPAALDLPRLSSPRTRVPAGSVAIAGGMCAIYPWDSPGGWHLIGRTAVRLFDPNREERPALLAPGDRVRWRAVARTELDSARARCNPGL